MKVIEIESKVQITQREWWQIYRKGWHRHNDLWGRKWWIRYNWNVNNINYKNHDNQYNRRNEDGNIESI